MPWQLVTPVSLDGLLTVVVFFASISGLLVLAALLGYLWECTHVQRPAGRVAENAAAVRSPRLAVRGSRQS